jgi:hypothetical protein
MIYPDLPNQPQRIVCWSLLQRLGCARVDVDIPQLRSVPSSAERFYQVYRGNNALTKQLRGQALVRKQCALRGNDVKTRGNTARVARIGQREGSPRILNCGILGSSST